MALAPGGRNRPQNTTNDAAARPPHLGLKDSIDAVARPEQVMSIAAVKGDARRRPEPHRQQTPSESRGRDPTPVYGRWQGRLIWVGHERHRPNYSTLGLVMGPAHAIKGAGALAMPMLRHSTARRCVGAGAPLRRRNLACRSARRMQRGRLSWQGLFLGSPNLRAAMADHAFA